ncbi:uncharacterized protein TM35_000232160 [Trypanosoma theileri]|uniref:Trans-sialidase n=1 Tax=Trypanosoma theileri TaxID=67003 RepID=A0A1X0NRA3_9TRYP|nr:uncharacterized protein TM35_000232160 [Trypanosoma theileri]ORC87245.1 hypothetical protein TM35_000232160 [Trypanosoma theileri]
MLVLFLLSAAALATELEGSPDQIDDSANVPTVGARKEVSSDSHELNGVSAAGENGTSSSASHELNGVSAVGENGTSSSASHELNGVSAVGENGTSSSASHELNGVSAVGENGTSSSASHELNGVSAVGENGTSSSASHELNGVSAAKENGTTTSVDSVPETQGTTDQNEGVISGKSGGGSHMSDVTKQPNTSSDTKFPPEDDYISYGNLFLFSGFLTLLLALYCGLRFFRNSLGRSSFLRRHGWTRVAQPVGIVEGNGGKSERDTIVELKRVDVTKDAASMARGSENSEVSLNAMQAIRRRAGEKKRRQSNESSDGWSWTDEDWNP